MSEISVLSAALGPPTVVERQPRYGWHSFDLATGRRGTRVRTEKLGTVGRKLGEPSDLSGLAVRIDDTTDWQAATEVGRAGLMLLDEDTEQPLWAGMVLRRRSTAGDWVTVDLVTHEAYFDRRYTRDHTFLFTDQTVIAGQVILIDALTAFPNPVVKMTVDAPDGTGPPRNRQYHDDEDKTVLSVLDDLAGVEDGIEWTVDLQWEDPSARTVLEPVVRVRRRLGVASATPAAVFTMPGCVTDFEYLEDYSAEYGANLVLATSSGEGDSRPTSSYMQAVQPGWPVYERRFTPSTSLTDKIVLDLHARAELAQTWDGLKQLELTARASVAPRVGQDWSLGDDVAVQLTCPRFPARTDADGALVAGYTRVVRAIGWDLDLDGDTVKPLLVELEEPEVQVL